MEKKINELLMKYKEVIDLGEYDYDIVDIFMKELKILDMYVIVYNEKEGRYEVSELYFFFLLLEYIKFGVE